MRKIDPLTILIATKLRDPGELKTQLAALTDLEVKVRTTLDKTGMQDVKKHTEDVQKGFVSVGQQAEKVGKTVKQYPAHLKDANKHILTQTHAWNQMAKQMGIIENFVIAIKRIPIWMAGMTAFYAPLRALQQGVRDVIEIDQQLTNLRKVMEGTLQDFRDFALEANRVGDEVGRTTQEILAISVEFGRLGYNLKEAGTLAKEAAILANVGVMTVEESTRALIAMTKGFGIEIDQQGRNVRAVVDMVNEVGKIFHLPPMLATA